MIIDLPRSRVRVIVGPYNTICRSGDVWKVMQLFNEMLEKKRCPTCNQEVR